MFMHKPSSWFFKWTMENMMVGNTMMKLQDGIKKKQKKLHMQVELIG